jgi:uncharacterized integral membrane protein
MKTSLQLNLLRWVTVLPLLIVLFAFITGIESSRLNVSAEVSVELIDEESIDNDA